MKDTYRHQGMRKRLIKVLKTKGIENESILEAFSQVPRHFFMESAFEERAYQDEAFPIGHGQTISQPFTVAFQTQLLNLKKGDKVLEIGTGSGFQAAILAQLGARVYSVERQQGLHLTAKKLLKDLGFGVKCYYHDGSLGLPELAPFDHIIVTAGITHLPKSLYGQLALGGNCVIPVGDKVQVMYRITRTGLAEFKKEEFGNFAFVPFLKGRQQSKY